MFMAQRAGRLSGPARRAGEHALTKPSTGQRPFPSPNRGRLQAIVAGPKCLNGRAVGPHGTSVFIQPEPSGRKMGYSALLAGRPWPFVRHRKPRRSVDSFSSSSTGANPMAIRIDDQPRRAAGAWLRTSTPAVASVNAFFRQFRADQSSFKATMENVPNNQRNQPAEDMQVIVHGRKTKDRDGEIFAIVSSRSSIHALRCSKPSPHRKALWTKREMPWL